MMDFSLTDEQKALVESASRFARNRLAPGYRAREKAECGAELVMEMGELGFSARSCRSNLVAWGWIA
jgi:cyclohexanecarboxyl-CoA dehydrogenase